MSKSFFQLIDFHSHILPGADDGAKNLEVSLEMMDEAARQKVCCMVATPHFYPSSDSPERFFARRTRTLTALREAAKSRILIIPGAEVAYFDGISTSADVRKMRIGKSRLLLVEMPFGKWSNSTLSDIISLSRDPSVRVVIAHLERYMHYQEKATVDSLRQAGVMIQSNAEFFIDPHTRRLALKMLESGEIDFLGSDAHNLADRRPNLGEAAAIITQNLGEDILLEMQRKTASLIMESSR